MRTPRPSHPRPRGIGTLIGNGWLREAPRNAWPRGWDIRGRSAMRKCMFLPLPEHLAKLGPPVSPAAVPQAKPAARDRDAVFAPARRDPRKDARLLPAVSPADVQAKLYAAKAPRAPEPSAWYEDPIALGSLLILFPPIGLAALWSSKRYSTDARWALTVMTALTMCAGCAIAIAAIALR